MSTLNPRWAEAFFKAQPLGVGALLLFAEGFGHAPQAHGGEFVESGFGQHEVLSGKYGEAGAP